jgi:hypothetical protein
VITQYFDPYLITKCKHYSLSNFETALSGSSFSLKQK